MLVVGCNCWGHHLSILGARRTDPSRLAFPRFPTRFFSSPHLPRRPPAVLCCTILREFCKITLTPSRELTASPFAPELKDYAQPCVPIQSRMPKIPVWTPHSPAPPPAPIHNPSGRLPLHTLPLPPALSAIRRSWNVSVTLSSSAMNTVLEAPQPRVAQKGMGRGALRAGGGRGEDEVGRRQGRKRGKLRGRSRCEGENPLLSCCTKGPRSG